MKINHDRKNEVRFPAGQTLIETVLALGVAISIIAALVGMSIISLRSSNFSRSKSIASQLLLEEVEKVRIYRDTNTYSGLVSDLSAGTALPSCASPKGYFYLDSSQNLHYSLSNPETVNLSGLGFNRWFSACIPSGAAGELQITVNVNWTDSAGTHPLKATTYFSNWR